MNNLFSYVAAFKGQPAPVTVEHQEWQDLSYQEGDTEVDCQQAIVRFSNGVVLSFETESEKVPEEQGVCPECWISYRVTEQPEQLVVTPAKKSFINPCQEAFWLKIQRQQLAAED